MQNRFTWSFENNLKIIWENIHKIKITSNINVYVSSAKYYIIGGNTHTDFDVWYNFPFWILNPNLDIL
jgi:hypothetical protein